MASFRMTKQFVDNLLQSDSWQERLPELDDYAPKKLVGTLFSLLLSPAPEVPWRAVTAFGKVVDRMARENFEDARIVMRQLIWRMNEESGNIGWGIGETWGEIMAVNERLANEYHTILLSYVQEYEGICHGNFLDHPPLRWGVLWGLGRLAQERPELLEKGLADLEEILNPAKAMEGKEGTYEGLECHDAQARGLACWALGNIGAARSMEPLSRLLDDQTPVSLFRNNRLESTTVSALAREAVERIES